MGYLKKLSQSAGLTVVEHRINQFLAKHHNETLGLTKVEQFCSKYHILLSDTFDDYCNRIILKKRVTTIICQRIIMIIFIVRFLICAIVDTPSTRTVMGNANYLLGSSRTVSTFLSIAGTLVLSIVAIVNTKEVNGTHHMIRVLNDIKLRTIKNPLNSKNRNKYGLICNLLADNLLNRMFIPLFITFFVMLSVPSIIAYNDNNLNLFSVIVWLIPNLSFSFQFFNIVFAGASFWFLSMTYIKMQFGEINDQIEASVALSDKHVLMQCILKHHQVTTDMYEMSNFMKEVVFCVYLFATPALDLFLYLSCHPTTNSVARFVFIYLTILCALILFTLTFMSAKVTKTAHRSRPLIHTFLLKRSDLCITDRLKVQKFNSKLSGADIGFYCLDIFPLNNYHFFDYCGKLFYSYILIVQLIG